MKNCIMRPVEEGTMSVSWEFIQAICRHSQNGLCVTLIIDAAYGEDKQPIEDVRCEAKHCPMKVANKDGSL